LAKTDGVHLTAKDVAGKKVLILGEVGSGKTLLVSRLLKELMSLFDAREVTVIDMAPEAKGEVGGRILDYVDSIDRARYLSPEKVYTPRISGNSCEQVLKYAELNREAIEPLLNEFSRNPTRILILNDVTLYLHTGTLERILACMNRAETVVTTAYRGSKLGENHGSGISVRERRLVEALATHSDQMVDLDRKRYG
jgi:GTPase SAR1 family protein